MEGTVNHEAKPVPGAPVFLWPVSESARRSLHGYRAAIADVAGHFSFDGLPPGDYKLFATFDMTEIDEDRVEDAHPITLHVDAGGRPSADLSLWIAP
jgi:hypothetical protein